MMFHLDPKLKEDTIYLMDLPLSMALYFKDSELPWIILVPRTIQKVTEFYELSSQDQQALMEEINVVSLLLIERFHPKKLNIGMLGNIVSQLHIHIIGRFAQDRAWPGPVWGHPAKSPFDLQEKSKEIEDLKEALSNSFN